MMATMSETSQQASPGTDTTCKTVVPTRVDVRIAAMNLLARREHARSELELKLQRRFADTELIAGVLDQLSNENLQSDVRFAESLLRQRVGRGYGPNRVRQEMRDRGLSQALVLSALDSVAPDWFAAAEAAYERKFGHLDGLGESTSGEPAAGELGDDSLTSEARRAIYQRQQKEKARRMRFMQYRGFLPEHFRHLLEG